jgi:hypothetical protein
MRKKPPSKATSATQATATVNSSGTALTAAETAFHTAFSGAYTQTANDSNLANAGITQPDQKIAGGAANAPTSTFAEIGAVFNDLVAKSEGGFVDPNAVLAETQQIESALHSLIKANPTDFGDDITMIHANTIVDQLQLEKQFINEIATDPTNAALSTNDNLLDIIDIVQGDPALAKMATSGDVTGWSNRPAGAAGNPHFQDNADQTNFWGQFIALNNAYGAAAEALVGTGNTAAINTPIHDLQTCETNVTNFGAKQIGPFFDRFANELDDAMSTNGADIAAMIHGLADRQSDRSAGSGRAHGR